MELILSNFILLINIIVCLLIIGLSIYYFIKVRNKFRWVKLCWALEIGVYLLILGWTLLGGRPTKEMQYLTMMLPLTAILYGLIVAFARQKESIMFRKLEEKFNGELENWINESLNTPSK